uniref:Uncharacterized protein n=1 Tax=Timspurckia oligopyrenoides TaxID=708627 RepID=A0A7S1EQB5_9RHOD|mmetsp:Transcript_12517/g.22589  ORF Transcript_12517/g.22589 Transcript_12517/m.22589 type:complete len:101 (+) Transcript_12517:345-647(+)
MSNISSPRIVRAQETVKQMKDKWFRLGSRDGLNQKAVVAESVPSLENESCEDVKFAIDQDIKMTISAERGLLKMYLEEIRSEPLKVENPWFPSTNVLLNR